MSGTTFRLDTRDQHPVVVHHWEPGGPVRGVVNLAHGMAEHAARYAPLATALTDRGLAVYAEDHRGHGESATDEDDLGFLAPSGGWALVLDDLHRLTQRARADHPDVPLFVFGHSMGSFLAQQYLFTFPDEIDGLVLSGSNGPNARSASAGAIVARAEMRRLGPRGRSTLLDNLAFGSYNRRFRPNRTDFDWLSRDPGQVDRYVADPWCGFVATTRMYLDLFAGLRVIARADGLRDRVPPELPVYVFSGTDDPVGGREGVDRLLAHYATAGLTDVQHRLYDGGRHEMLNETNRDEVVADLLAWFEDHLER